MRCTNCNNELRDGARFCAICGTPIAADTPSPESAQTAIPEEIADYRPEGFTFDPKSQLFYRYVFKNDVSFVIWYDPWNGMYEAAQTGLEQGQALFVYAPPESFEFDPHSLRYFRSEIDENNVLWIVWFDAITGEYEEAGFPLEEGSAPAQEQVYDPPEGFTLDNESGLYYKAIPGQNAKTKELGSWYTWFNPSTGEYQQQFHSN